MTTPRYRDATVADVPAIVGLVTRAYRGEASRAGWTTEADLLDGNRIVPELQRAGIGRAILAEAERVVREDWRLPRMCMTVIDLRTELIAWYQRRGYRLTGETRPFPATDPRFGLPRRDDLRFAVLEKVL